MKIAYRHAQPRAVLFARSNGPYVTAARDAWKTMGRWLDARNARSMMRVSYGLFRDNPKTTAADILRYDACIPLVIGLEEDEGAGIQRQVLPGGAYAVHVHRGALEATGAVFSELYRNELPRRGLQLDEDRAFLATYLTDPTVTRTMHCRTELCVPGLSLTKHAGERRQRRPNRPAGDVCASSVAKWCVAPQVPPFSRHLTA
jgi:AraC family transcriptional regulator